jgi:type IV pilus assembly protein PilQ
MTTFHQSPLRLIGTPMLRSLLLLLASSLAFNQAHAQATTPMVETGTASAPSNAIESISTNKVAGGRMLVKINFKEALSAAPTAFSIATPPRIAFDFNQTANALGRATQAVGDPNLRNINVVQAGARTRLVMNLTKMQSYEMLLDGKSLAITLFDPPGSTLAESGQDVSRFSQAKADVAASYSIRDVDFRRGKDGEARVIIDLSDPGSGVDIKTAGKFLAVDFLRTTLPRNLERKLDVTDFGTPVLNVDAFQQGATAKLLIEPKGLWEHSAYQTDNRLVIEIRPIIEDPNKLTQGTKAGYKGDRLSLNFQDVAVRSVMQVIGDFTGLNIIVSDTVTGNVTLRLKDVPWDQALDLLMQTRGLDMRKNGSVVWIAPREELATKEKLELEAKQQISELEPVRTEVFQLNYQKASVVQKMLAPDSLDPKNSARNNSVLSKRGSALVDERSNILIVQDIPSRLDEVRKLLNKIDIAVKQVMIETRIVIADDNFSKQLGVRFGTNAAGRVNKNIGFGTSGRLGEIRQVAADGTVTFVSGSDANATGVPQYIKGSDGGLGTLNVNLPVVNPAGALALSFLNLGSGNLINLELSALEANNRGKVVSSPRLVTSDNTKAIIEQGTEIPYITPGSGSANIPAVAFKKAVLSLAVTPQITPDNRIIMNLEVTKDSVGQEVGIGAGGRVPSIDTKRLTTQISVNNGETAVIGGIYEEVTRGDINKIPLLGDLPYIGNLFKNTSKREDKTELLIFITPRIVTDALSVTK